MSTSTAGMPMTLDDSYVEPETPATTRRMSRLDAAGYVVAALVVAVALIFGVAKPLGETMALADAAEQEISKNAAVDIEAPFWVEVGRNQTWTVNHVRVTCELRLNASRYQLYCIDPAQPGLDGIDNARTVVG